MMRRILMLVALLCGVVGVKPVLAQKAAPAVTRDTDRDGVPDTRDRCRNTERGARVGADGCPAAGTSAPQTAANPAGAPTQTATNPRPGPTAPTSPPPAVTPPVQQQAQPPTTPSTSQPVRPNADSIAAANRAREAAVTPPVVNPPVSRPDSNAPANTRPNRPSGLPTAVVPPPAPAPAPAPTVRQPAVDSSVTAGFWMPAYGGNSEADVLTYARNLVLRTDSAIGALVDVFRNTSGAPMAGATSPNVISSRERGRWDRCRLLHFDLRTLADAAAFLKDSLPGGPTLRRAMAGLDDAFQGLAASEECDNVVSMIQAPDRWSPWQQNYETSARSFYRDWYTQLRAIHAANRTLVGVLNPRLADRAVPVPGALPPRAPTLGGT